MIPNEVIIFLGIFLGCLFRSLAPFVRKLREAMIPEEKPTWNHVYTLTFITSLLVALATALIAFASFTMPPDPFTPLKLLAFCFLYGVGMNSTLNEVANWFGA